MRSYRIRVGPKLIMTDVLVRRDAETCMHPGSTAVERWGRVAVVLELTQNLHLGFGLWASGTVRP